MFKLIKIVFGTILFLAYSYVSASILIFEGPFTALKDQLIHSLVSTTRFQYAIKPLSLYTVTDAQIQSDIASLYQAPPVIDAPQEVILSKNFEHNTSSGIQTETYTGKTFTAQLLYISNPKRVQVAVTQDMGETGETVSEMAERLGAIAGINGGGFSDPGYRGTGGTPLGITIHQGKFITNNEKDSIIGFNNKGVLIVGDYTASQLSSLHVTEAVSFSRSVLIQNGKGVIEGDGGWGYAPRSAIAQKSDGTVIFLVTDGRMVHGPQNLGATLKDIEQLLLQKGAVTAANLDGGSSSTLYYNHQLLNDPTDWTGERKVATSFLVSS